MEGKCAICGNEISKWKVLIQVFEIPMKYPFPERMRYDLCLDCAKKSVTGKLKIKIDMAFAILGLH